MTTIISSSIKTVACTMMILMLPVLASAAEVTAPTAHGTSSEAATSDLQVVQRAETDQPHYNWRSAKTVDDATAALGGTDRNTGSQDPSSGKVHSWETGEGKSFLIPAWEVPTFLILLNLYDRVIYSDEREDNGKKTYSSNFSTTWEHIRKQNWDFDKDPFNVNQFAHPYQGATMYGLARSCGLNFWQSWAYSSAGSFLYEMAGETSRPSINDIITTPNSGSLLGEALFRMSALVLREQETPDAWHEVGAAIVSPPTAVNRWLFGERFKSVFPTNSPATFWRFRLGMMFDAEKDATLDFAMSYGLPGKAGYTYKRPLDYFDFQISGLANTGNPVGNVLLRGLLYGKPYDFGQDYRGIWGLYGSYDYISPTIFRVSTTALSVGTTAQYWMSRDIALQGTVLGGVGFGAAGVTPARDGERDYHYGLTPQGMLALRMIFGKRLAVENVTRGYYVSGTGSDNSEGTEAIVRNNSNLTLRVFKRHGLGLQLIEAVRNASYGGNHPNRHQTNLTVGVFYSFLGDVHLGSVEWRSPGEL